MKLVSLALGFFARPSPAHAAEDESSLTFADRARGAFFGALVSDALCLGSHYEYDAPTIKKAYGGKVIERYMAPGEEMGGSTHGVGWGRRNYHPGQKAGDQTDYGEYTLLSLEYFAAQKFALNERVELKTLVPFWEKRVNGNWGAWKCTQTKQALQQVQAGTPLTQLGGMSNAMSLRSAAVFGVYDSEDAAAQASTTLMFTHRSSEAQLGGEFFTRATFKIVNQGISPRKALEVTCAEMGKKHRFVKDQCEKGFAKAKEVADPNSQLSKEEFVDDLAMTSMARLWEVGKSEPIKVGKASPTEGTMPSSIYMILKYENDFTAAVKANAMVGGDNAARSVAIGMVLGAAHGTAAIQGKLRTGLNAWKKSEALLDQLPRLKTRNEL